MSTQLFNAEGNKIYPITEASAVTSATGKGNVEDCLADIYSQLSDSSGASQAIQNLVIEVAYTRATTTDEATVQSLTSWGSTFELPSSNYPYTWKRTKYSAKGVSTSLKTIYEIVASDTAEVTQTIYIAKGTSTEPKITYTTNDEGEEDLTCFDNSLPSGWTETPQSISAGAPYVYVSTRKKVNGAWERFSTPALLGKWAFDSKVELRYTVTSTSTAPTVSRTTENPGSDWSESGPTSDFTGYLWLITANSVNGVLSVDSGVIWSEASLISIVK